MREIKFRSWLKMKQEMLYDFTILNQPHIPNEENILMQYTGLKDKNGQEIYEGDVVRKRNILGVVIWANEYQSLGFYLKSNENLYNVIAPYYSWDLEIIGNIYEHPELLSKETNK